MFHFRGWSPKDPSTSWSKTLVDTTVKREQWRSSCHYLSDQNGWNSAFVELDGVFYVCYYDALFFSTPCMISPCLFYIYILSIPPCNGDHGSSQWGTLLFTAKRRWWWRALMNECEAIDWTTEWDLTRTATQKSLTRSDKGHGLLAMSVIWLSPGSLSHLT